MEFLARLPSLRSPQELLALSLEMATGGFRAWAGVARCWGQASEETRRGEWPEEALTWLDEPARVWKEGAGRSRAARLKIGRQHYLAAPLAAEGPALGMLAVCRPNAFTLAHEETILLLGRSSGAYLQNLYQSARAHRQEEQLALLCDVGKAMNSILDVRKLVEEIVQRGQEALEAEACSVLLVDEERQELFFEIAKGEAGAALKQVRLKLDQGIAGWIATNSQPLIINDVSRDPRFFSQVDEQVRFATRSIIGVPLLARGKTIGVIEVLNKRDGSAFTTENLELLTALAANAAMSIDNARLFQAVLDGYLDTTTALAAAVEAKDPYTAGHVDRASAYCLETGEVLGLSEEELTALRYGAILHDVGKIGISDAILRKPAPLSQEEFTVMTTHAAIGSDLVEGIRFLETARPIIRHHHEAYDGSGYPDGLAGNTIPLGSRIIAVVDAFDAMTTDRPYRKALTLETAAAELRKMTGSQFDGRMVEAFSRVLQRRGLLK